MTGPELIGALRAWPMPAQGEAGPVDIAQILDAAAARIEQLEAAIEPFAGAANFVATAAPPTMALRFGFQAQAFRNARSVYLGFAPLARAEEHA